MGYTQRQSTIVGVHWSLFGVATIVVAARLFVRTRLRPGSLGWDDWTMLLAYGLTIGAGVVETLLVEDGVGKHMEYVNPENLPEVAKLTLINSIINLLGTMMVKVSVCLFLLRMVHLANRTVKWLVTINMLVLVPVTIAIIIVDLVQCIPLEGYWNKTIPARCINADTVNILLKTASAVGVVTDFMTAAIPIAVVCRLKMPRNQKYAIFVVLALGFLTAAASIAKTIVIHWTPTDYTWDNSQVGYWGALEHEGGIIVACFPTLRPILQYFQSRFGAGPNSNNRELNPATSWTLRGTTNKKRANSEDGLLHDEDDTQIRKMTEVKVSLETREAAPRLGDVPNLHWDPSGRNREASSQSAASYGGATTRAEVE